MKYMDPGLRKDYTKESGFNSSTGMLSHPHMCLRLEAPAYMSVLAVRTDSWVI